MGMGSVRGVRMREDREAHGVRGGFPPKGGNRTTLTVGATHTLTP